MGARQSRRSVDITTTQKKESATAEVGAPVDEIIEKLGAIEEIPADDAKPTSNGVAPHSEEGNNKEKDKDEATEKYKDKEKVEETGKDNLKTDETSATESLKATDATLNTSGSEIITPTEPVSPASPTDTPNTKEAKKKEKKKKWSFRSISFSRKDKSRPKDSQPKNGEVTKEEPLAESGDEVEIAAAVTTPSSLEDKSSISCQKKERNPGSDLENNEKDVDFVNTVQADPIPVTHVEEPAVADKKEETVGTVAEAAHVAENKVEVSAESSGLEVTTAVRKINEETTINIDQVRANSFTPVIIENIISKTSERSMTEPSLPTPSPGTTIIAEVLIFPSENVAQAPASPLPNPTETLPLQHVPSASTLIESFVAKEQPVKHLFDQPVEQSEKQTDKFNGQAPIFLKEAELGNDPEQVTFNKLNKSDNEDEGVPPPLPESPAPTFFESPCSKAANFAANAMLHDEEDEELPLPHPHSDVKFTESEEIPVIVPQVQSNGCIPEPSTLNMQPEEKLVKNLESDNNEEEKYKKVAAFNKSEETSKQESGSATQVAEHFANGYKDETSISPPPVLTETTPQPPVITEDVASVTKAIEEIDINEKAVVAAVNDTIESAGMNEIVADGNYQNITNE